MSASRITWKLGEVLPNGATVVECHLDYNGETGTVLARTDREYASWSIEIASGATFRGDYYGNKDLSYAALAVRARHAGVKA